MSTSFKVSFIINAKKLPLLLDVLKNEIIGLEVKQVEEGKLFGGPIRRKRSHATPANGKIPVKELALHFLATIGKGKTFNSTLKGELAKALENGGYSPTSCGPTTSMLTKIKKIKPTGNRGEYEVL